MRRSQSRFHNMFPTTTHWEKKSEGFLKKKLNHERWFIIMNHGDHEGHTAKYCRSLLIAIFQVQLTTYCVNQYYIRKVWIKKVQIDRIKYRRSRLSYFIRRTPYCLLPTILPTHLLSGDRPHRLQFGANDSDFGACYHLVSSPSPVSNRQRTLTWTSLNDSSIGC